MMLVSLAVAAFQSAGLGQAPSPEAWTVLARHDQGLVAVDRSNVAREAEGTVQYWAMAALTGGDTMYGTGYAYEIYRWTVDCERMTFSVDEGIDYGPEGQIREFEPASEPQPPQEMPPGSLIYRVADAVCRDRWGDEAPQPSALDVYRLSPAVD
ncbi:surface-adhesin E family protein [Brevundimonas sp.]|uniref:surface-adhesin E family protein n=1 Tax=Brevundimonas sp. TaxID=1871086 RepID=UPI002D6243F6|nr:surface-adhesin E family protein [Brevundimonas sp.]HYC97561.1 surface-adhesin E family protein [Brevundimonas sp.]